MNMTKFEERITIIENVTTCEVTNLDTGEVFVGKATRQEGDKNDWDLAVKIAKSKAHIKKCEIAIERGLAEGAVLLARLIQLQAENDKYKTEKENREEFLKSLKD